MVLRMEGFGGALAATVTGLIVQTTGSFVPALVVVRTDRRGVGGFPLFVVDQPITAVDMDAMSHPGVTPLKAGATNTEMMP